MCKDTDAKDKISHLQKTFEANGYPPRIVHKVLHKHRQFPVPANSTEEKEKPKILTLPYMYIKGLSEKIERVIKPLNIRAVFKTQTTIRQKVEGERKG